MSGDQGSQFEWRRKRGQLNRTLERAEDIPWSEAMKVTAPGTDGRFS